MEERPVKFGLISMEEDAHIEVGNNIFNFSRPGFVEFGRGLLKQRFLACSNVHIASIQSECSSYRFSDTCASASDQS